MSKKLIGHMDVDAGLCWVGDPCYIMGDNASSRVEDWSKFCDKLDQDSHYSAPLGRGIGYAITTGYGDGSYPVYVEVSNDATFGERVTSITIKFDE